MWISHSDTYIWSLKRWHWWIYFQSCSRGTDIENRPTDMVGWEEGEGEMCEESNIAICNTICKRDNQWEFALWLRQLKQGLCDRLKCALGGRSRREETWVYLWLALVDIWQKTTKFCKAVILQFLKKLFLKPIVEIPWHSSG